MTKTYLVSNLFLIVFTLSTTGCAPTIVTKTENSITLERSIRGQETYVLTDEAKKYCAKKGKIPDLVFKDGWTFKCK